MYYYHACEAVTTLPVEVRGLHCVISSLILCLYGLLESSSGPRAYAPSALSVAPSCWPVFVFPDPIDLMLY